MGDDNLAADDQPQGRIEHEVASCSEHHAEIGAVALPGSGGVSVAEDLAQGQRTLFPSNNRPSLACMDNLAFMQDMADEKFKLIVTSPPYNLGKEYEGKAPLDAYLAMQERVIRECVRLLHPQGSLCWQVGNYVQNGEIVPLDTILYPVFRDQGLKLRNRIVWHFGHGLHCTRRLSGRYETINWWTKGDDYTWNLDSIRVPAKYPGKRHFKGPNIGKLSGNPKGKNPSDVWVFPNVKSNHPEKTIHPCQFSRRIGGTVGAVHDGRRRRGARSLHGGRVGHHRRAHARQGRLWMRHRA